MEKLITAIIGFIFGLIGFAGVIAFFTIYGAVSWGVVVYLFWDWFLTPVFTQLPAITFVQAIGLSFFIGLFRNHGTTQIKKEYRDTNDSALLSLISPWAVLLIGWLAWLIFL